MWRRSQEGRSRCLPWLHWPVWSARYINFRPRELCLSPCTVHYHPLDCSATSCVPVPCRHESAEFHHCAGTAGGDMGSDERAPTPVRLPRGRGGCLGGSGLPQQPAHSWLQVRTQQDRGHQDLYKGKSGSRRWNRVIRSSGFLLACRLQDHTVCKIKWWSWNDDGDTKWIIKKGKKLFEMMETRQTKKVEHFSTDFFLSFFLRPAGLFYVSQQSKQLHETQHFDFALLFSVIYTCEVHILFKYTSINPLTPMKPQVFHCCNLQTYCKILKEPM